MEEKKTLLGMTYSIGPPIKKKRCMSVHKEYKELIERVRGLESGMAFNFKFSGGREARRYVSKVRYYFKKHGVEGISVIHSGDVASVMKWGEVKDEDS